MTRASSSSSQAGRVGAPRATRVDRRKRGGGDQCMATRPHSLAPPTQSTTSQPSSSAGPEDRPRSAKREKEEKEKETKRNRTSPTLLQSAPTQMDLPQPSRIAPGATPPNPARPSSGSSPGGSGGSQQDGITASARRLTEGKVPCARSSLLTGIATAGGITAIGLVTGRSMSHATRWGGGAFIVVSLASW